MDYAEDLLRELAQAEAFDQWRRGAASLARTEIAQLCLEPSEARKLALFRTEALNVGTVASVVASVANALESRCFPQLAPTSIGLFVPSCSALFEADIQGLSENGQMFTIVQLTQRLLAQMLMAQKLSSAFLASADQGSEDRFCPIDVVADSWRRVCESSLGVHKAIADCMAAAGHICPAEVEAGTLELLRVASQGGWPCITRTGQVSIPGWAERRVEQRVELHVPVSISYGPARFPAIVENATAAGLGLASAVGVKEGADLEIHLPDGRTVTGVVRWARSGKIGVRLQRPLQADDPLLCLGSRTPH
jgi:hypothetical protein